MTFLSEKKLFGGQQFIVIKDDIINQEVDAYVCPSNESFELGGQVAKSLIRKAGPQLVSYVSTQTKSQKLDALKAKLLRCQWLPNANSIVFVNGPTWNAAKATQCQLDLQNTVRNALLEADAQNVVSIAIPLIGGGVAGFPKDVAAEALVTGIKYYLNEPLTYLQSINKEESSIQKVFFVLYEEEAVAAFKKSVEELVV